MDSILLSFIILTVCIIAIYTFAVKIVLPRYLLAQQDVSFMTEPRYLLGAATQTQDPKLRSPAPLRSFSLNDDEETPKEVKMAAVRLSVEFTRSLKGASEGSNASEVERLSAKHRGDIDSLFQEYRQSRTSRGSDAVLTAAPGNSQNALRSSQASTGGETGSNENDGAGSNHFSQVADIFSPTPSPKNEPERSEMPASPFSNEEVASSASSSSSSSSASSAEQQNQPPPHKPPGREQGRFEDV
mmetsp:Transcript_68399/g.137558  ORF Transcript_68399/g.137558 Transcript_68399/m.137558 type:complete len:243 (+) Transcript_68399:90-818(+)